MFNRRAFLAAGLAAPFAPRLVRAVPLGSATLTTVSDGAIVLPAAFTFEGVPEGVLRPIAEEFGLGSDISRECNLTLFRDGMNTVLFDAGSGPDFMPTAGKLTENLEAAGLSPDEVTHVVFTHAHPDHIWGLLDDFGDPLFPEAVYMMGRAEWDYWWNPETIAKVGEAQAPFAVGAKRRMEAIEDAVTLFDDGDEILPGIAAVATHGHTPGHMSFELNSGGETALVVGDAIGDHHMSFAHPELHNRLDQDEEAAAKSRQMLIDKLATDRMLMVGFHLPEGGIGRAMPAPDGGYRFISEGA